MKAFFQIPPFLSAKDALMPKKVITEYDHSYVFGMHAHVLAQNCIFSNTDAADSTEPGKTI